jgi:mannose-6-phosphate isomerase-like protein (cupin superfamily)
MSSRGRWSTRWKARRRGHTTAGEALTVPAGVVHAVRNVGSGNAAELATYVVEKGKPLITLVE